MTLYVVTGPPASGKTTYVRQHAQPGDVTIDYDALANCLTPHDPAKPHHHPPHVRAITKTVRQAAVEAALKHSQTVDVYVIHSMPSRDLMRRYLEHSAQVVAIDPGIDVVLARCKAERPWQMQQAVKEWYANRAAYPVGTVDAADTSRQW